MKKSTKVKPLMVWKHYMSIDKTYVDTINDSGMVETYEGRERIDSDNLVISIELCDGSKVLLDGSFRIIFMRDQVVIEVLMEIND